MVAKKKIRRGSEVIRGCDHNLANSDDMKNHKQQKQRVDLLSFCDQCSYDFKGNADMKMHLRRNHAGEAKFWRSPELMSHLLTYLDVSSTIALALAHPFTISLLQNMFIWRDFIQRTKMKGGGKFREVESRKSFEMEVMEVELKQVVSIIYLADEPKPLLLELVQWTRSMPSAKGSPQL